MKKQSRVGRFQVLGLVLAAGMMLAGTAWGADFTSSSTGYWTNPVTWGDSPGDPTPTNAADNVYIQSSDTVTIDGTSQISINSLSITGTLEHAAGTSHAINLDIAGNLTIDAAGSINVDQKGQETIGVPGGRAGASHGGEGSAEGGTAGATYGSITNPVLQGSYSSMGNGGGVVILRVGGAFTNNGVITTGAAAASNPGAASAGSINLTVAGAISSSGTIKANGGQGDNEGGNDGPGGGGRIAIKLTGVGQTFANVDLSKVTAYGGGNDNNEGAAGTIYLKRQDQTYGDVIVNNNGQTTTAKTLFKDYSYRFDSITLTNQGVFVAGNGATLDLTGCPLASDSTTNSIGSRLILGTTGSTITWPASFTTAATISQIGATQITGINSLTIASGGILTHEYGSANAINLSLTGSLDLQSGGAIYVKGLSDSTTGLGGGRAGGGHGGESGLEYQSNPRASTFDSITNPVLPGCRGNYSLGNPQGGGGVVRVEATGAVTVDGTIEASGAGAGTGGAGGAGGTVNIRAASMAGGGSIIADGSANGNGEAGGGGGGRIAVALSGSDTFGSVTMTVAYGGTRPGAAGTICLKGMSDTYGKLIIPATTSLSSTLIGSLVTDAVVGDVELLSGARLAIDGSKTLQVYGNWSNASANAVGGTGEVALRGTDTATLYGSTTFPNLACTNGGKTLLFQEATTNAVTGNVQLEGESAGSKLTLESTNPSAQWYIKAVSGGTQVGFEYLAVSNSYAVTNGGDWITATFSDDNGGNVNWIFSNPADITWNGSFDTDWNTAANWDLPRTPLSGDPSITIPTALGTYPVLDKSYVSPGYDGTLIIESGASLSLGGFNLRIGGNVTNAGTLTCTGSETLTFEGDVDFTGGTFTPASSTLKLAAAAAGSQTFKPDGETFHRIEVPNAATVNIEDAGTDGFTADTLYCRAAGATLDFNAGSTYAVTGLLDLRGSAANDVVLTSSGTWNLNASGNIFVRYVAVDDSNALGGKKIYAVESEDNSGNSNWDFGNGKMWLGGDTDWGTAGNWSPSGVPGSSDYVFIDETGSDPTLAGSTTITGLTVIGFAETVTLTLNMAYAGGESLTVLDDAYIGTNATVTHSANSTTYRLDMDVDGNLTVDTGGGINVSQKGNSWLGSPGSRAGAGHGGEGGSSAGGSGGTTYGSITNPVLHGKSAKTWGGGAVILRIGGALTNSGIISADGGPGDNPGAASGGSINVTVDGAIASSGTISADGGDGDSEGAWDSPGGGGRIAIRLTGVGQTFGNVDLSKVSAIGGTELLPGGDFTRNGASGTIYLKRQDQTYGALMVPTNSSSTLTANTLVSPSVTGTTVGDVELQGGANPARFAISSGYSMTVYGSWSNAAGATAMSGGTVELAGTDPNPVTVWGGNNWSNLTIVTASKTVNFQAGATQTVYGVPAFSNVTLQSTVADAQWHLRKSGSGTQDVGVVTVYDSNAGTPGVDLTFFGALGSNVSDAENVNWDTYVPPGTVFLLR